MVAQAPSSEARARLDLAPVAPPAAPTEDEVLFDGFVSSPAQTAALLLLLGRVARHRCWLPPGMVAARIATSDPVITTSGSGIRLESFSACGGVALRLDLDRDGLDRAPARRGTTNVDLSGPTRHALTEVHGVEPLHLRVSSDARRAATFSTLDRTVDEARAALPERWVRGFAEAQAAGAGLEERHRVGAAAARRFWRGLPRNDGGTSVLHVARTPAGDLHLTGTASASTVPLGGPSRLRLLEPVLRFATSLTAYGPASPDAPGVSVWQLDLDGGALTCALSPAAARGFSGEGGLLHRLAVPVPARTVEAVAACLDAQDIGDVVDAVRLRAATGLSQEEVEAGLEQLAAAGRLGYDQRARAYFYRELPFAPASPEALNPRLAAARRLVAHGTFAVREDGSVDVRHGDSHHRVTGRGPAATCTCPWVARHGSSRGPCKHVLAVGMTAAASSSGTP